MSLAVVTDSAACLPAALAAERGIEVVELPVLTDDEGAATTSRPSVAALTEAYGRALERADEVLALHVGAALSGTVDNALLAARALDPHEDGARRVTVLDLGVSGGALGLAVLAAAEAGSARRGAARARELAARSSLFFLVEDLSCLHRGGRVDRTTALLGSTLGIRPVLRVATTGIEVVEAVRGRGRARRRLIELAVGEAGGPVGGRRSRRPATPVQLAVHYGDDPADGRELENDLAEAMAQAGTTVETIMRSPADAATRVHVGPGALGVVVAPALGG
ncbi:DegV family protein [Actinomyces sp. W5033]|uniref:DegV family protein n=1 Tax=Actinomyces sp. W5033 TaxID=3446479 RepID=UPI003EE3618C